MKKVAIFGDSFVEGVGDDQGGGWPKRFLKKLNSKIDAHIDGVGGRNISDVRSVVLPFLESETVECLILDVGINDSRYRASKSDLETPVDLFSKLLSDIISAAKQNGVKHVVIVGSSRVDETLVLDYKPDKSHTNKAAEIIDQALASAADDRFSIYVPISHFINHEHSPPTLADGLHPNAIGHEMIAQEVFNAIVARSIG